MAASRIQVEITGQSSELQAAAAKAADSLKALGDVVARQSELAVKAGDQTVNANRLVARSFQESALAAQGASRDTIRAFERQGAVVLDSSKVQQDALARTGAAARLSADEQAQASARAGDAARLSADQQVAAAERSKVAQDASASAATRAATVKTDAAKRSAAAFGAESSAMTKAGRTISTGLLGIGAASVYMAVKFQSNTLRMQTQAGATAQQLDKLRQGLIRMAGAVGYTPNQLADGMYHVVSAMNATLPPTQRVTGELTVMAQAAKLAHIGNSNLEETTYALVSAMNALHEPISQTSKVASQLNAIVGAGDMTMQDLVDSFSSGLLPAAQTAGISLRSVGAAMATMGDLGMRGALAGTRLRMSIALLSSPSEAAAKVLDTLGMSSKQATSTSEAMAKALEKAGLRTTTLSADLRQPDGILVALRDLKTHLEASGLTATGAAAVMNKAFGGGRMGATITLLADSTQRLQTKFQQIGHDSSPALWSADWNRWLHTSQGEIDTFKSGIAGLATNLGTHLLPAFNTGIHDISQFIDWLEKGSTAAHVLEGVVGTFALVTVGSYFTSKVKQAIGLLNDFKNAAGFLGRSFGLGSGPSPTSRLTPGSAAAVQAGNRPLIDALMRTQTVTEQLTAALDRNIVALQETRGGGGVMSGLEHFGIGGARSGLGLPGSVPNPIITATEAGEYAGLGSMGAAGTVANEQKVAQAESGAIAASGARTAVTGGVTAAESAAAASAATVLPQAEKYDRTLMQGIMGPLSRGLGALMKGGMIAGVGALGAQAVGGMIGGKAGKAVGSIGSTAAIGAGLGSMLGPEGTIAGGVLGGLVGGFKAFLTNDANKYGDQIAAAVTRTLPVAVSAGYGSGIAKALNTAHGLKVDATSADAQPGAVRGIRQNPAADNAAANKQFAAAGAKAGEAFVASFSQVQYKSTPAFFTDFMAVANKLPAQSRDAAAKVAIQFAQGLVEKGQLPKDATRNLIFQLESQFPGLGAYLKSQGESTAKDVADQMKMTTAVSNLQQTVTAMKTTFGVIPADFGGDMQVTGQNMATKLQQAMTVLKADMSSGTTAMRQAATQQYDQLKQQAGSDLAALVSQTADKMASLKTAVSTNSQQAAQIGSQNFRALALNIASYVGSGAEATGKGLASITAQVNAELKQFGEKGLSAVQIQAATPGQLAALVSGQVSAGGLASPHATGGWVGSPGEKGRDNVPIVVGRGEAVLNHQQQQIVNSSLAATGMGSLAHVFAATSGTRHWMAAGGFAGGGIVTASDFGGPADPGTGSTGYRGDNLYQHPDSYAELNMGTALGSLPYLAPLDVTFNGRTARLFKRDIGAGGPGLGGHVRAIDLWFQAAQSLGFPYPGLADVMINGPAGVNVKVAGGGAGAASAFTPIKAPTVSGTGAIAALTQDALNKAAAAANSYLQSKAPAMGGVSLLGGGQPSVAPKNAPAALARMIAEANAIASHNYPYEWGGGHGALGVPSGAIAGGPSGGPGVGFDCSGAVSAVLGAAGLITSPMAASDYMSWGLPGAGRWVSIFADPSHTFMELNGRYFGTSGQNPGGGANWIPSFPGNIGGPRHPLGLATGGYALKDALRADPEALRAGILPDIGHAWKTMGADAKTHFPTHVIGPGHTTTSHGGSTKTPKAPGTNLSTKDMQELAQIGGKLNTLEQWIAGLQGTYTADTTMFGPEEAMAQYLNADGSLNAAGFQKKIADDQTLLSLDFGLLNLYNQEVPLVSAALSKWLGKQSKLEGTIKADTSKLDADKLKIASNKVKEASIRKAILDLSKPTPNEVQTIQDQIAALKHSYDGQVLKAERAQSAYLGPEESHLNKLKANVLAAEVSRANYTGTDKATIKRLNQAVTDAKLAETTYENSQAPTKAALAAAVKNARLQEQDALYPLQGALDAARTKQHQRAYRIKVEKFGLQKQLETLTREDTKISKTDTGLSQTISGLKGILSGSGGGVSTNQAVSLIETVAGKLGMVEWGTDGSFAGINTAMPGEIVSVKADILSLQNDIGAQQSAQTGAADTSTQDSNLIALLQQANLQLSETLALNEAQTAALASMIPEIPQYAKGGPVISDGLIYAHAGEHVVPRGGTLVASPSSPQTVVIEHHYHEKAGALMAFIDQRIRHPDNINAVSKEFGRRTSLLRPR